MGVESAVILPSVWLYLQMFHVDYWYLGLVLSVYSAVPVASAIVVGRLADGSVVNILLLGIVLNLFEVVGNIIYSLHFHVSMPLLGRLVAGVGDGYVSAIYGVLARATTENERTRYFAVIKGSNLLGIAFGPALNFFLKDFNFYIGRWHIDYRTSPGFFMAITWAFFAGIMYLLAYDLSDEVNQYESVSSELCGEKLAKQRQLREAYGIESSGDEHDATLSTEKTTDVVDHGKIVEKKAARETREAVTATFKNALVDIFSKLQVIVPLYALFFSGILHTSLQAITPLVAAERKLNWSETTVVTLFTTWGAEIIVIVFILWFLSPRIPDRVMLLMSAIFGIPASASVFLLDSFPDKVLLPAVFLQGISLAAVVVIGRSMVSKHTNSENQATGQAIVTATTGTCNTVGPLIGSSLFTHEKILATILTGSQILGLLLVILAFKKIKF